MVSLPSTLHPIVKRYASPVLPGMVTSASYIAHSPVAKLMEFELADCRGIQAVWVSPLRAELLLSLNGEFQELFDLQQYPSNFTSVKPRGMPTMTVDSVPVTTLRSASDNIWGNVLSW